MLGIWIQTNEGAKFWAGVCAERANRGVRDALIVCCDGLSGFAEAIETTWTNATVQTFVVHLIRAATRFVGYQHRKAIAAALKLIYQAVKADAIHRQLLDDAQDEGAQEPGADPGGHCGAALQSNAADLPPHIDTSDQPLPGPARKTLHPTS